MNPLLLCSWYNLTILTLMSLLTTLVTSVSRQIATIVDVRAILAPRTPFALREVDARLFVVTFGVSFCATFGATFSAFG